MIKGCLSERRPCLEKTPDIIIYGRLEIIFAFKSLGQKHNTVAA